MKRLLVLLYGLSSYAVFVAVLVYFILFVCGVGVDKTVDSGVSGNAAQALLIDVLLIALFGIQHSVMARKRFKAWWTSLVPESIERSTYVLATTAAFVAIIWGWQPLTQRVWDAEGQSLRIALYGASGAGWLLVLMSTFMTNHFDLFGLRQVYLYAIGRRYTPIPFEEKWLYRWIRHPMMLGVFIAIWFTPTMSLGHLVLALGFSLYIFIGVYFEERSLKLELGEPYIRYVNRTRGFVPMSIRPRA